jgi:hypothetical protein
MDLSILHGAIRGLVRDTGRAAAPDVQESAASQMSPTERAALNALQRRLRGVGGDLAQLVPPAGSLVWMASPQPGRSE